MRPPYQRGLKPRAYTPVEPFFGVLRAVVVAVYYADDTNAPGPHGGRQPVCDLVTLSDSRFPLYGVPILQHGSAITNGSAWVPQPCRANLDGGPVEVVPAAQTPAPSLDALDGDRVLVTFVDGKLDSPVIIGTVPHPRTLRPHRSAGAALPAGGGADYAADPAPDGLERWVGHQGTVARIDRAGNALLDTTSAGTANDGESVDAEGAGHLDVNIAPGASVVLRFGGRAEFHLRVQGEGDGQRVVLDVGKGADQRVVLGDRLMALFDLHQHTTFYGQTGPVTPATSMSTAQADGARAALSDRVKVRS